MDINQFITDNYTLIIIIVVVLLMTIIGYIAKKTGFGQKVAASNDKDNDLKIEEINNSIQANQKLINKQQTEVPDALDTIVPNFNDGGLVVGDVNQNPDKTNEELGISEDLYAPFGDQNTNPEPIETVDVPIAEPSIEDLKIEDVDDKEEFNILEKNNNEDGVEELIIKDVNTEDSNNMNFEELKIEDIDIDNKNNSSDPIVEEINDLVDNTYVINDATEEFIETNEPSNEEKIENKNEKTSVLANFDINESDMAPEEPSNFEVEQTTSLKLDEINEKIKNLKLEDIDNQEPEELLEEVKKKKKKKQVRVKSVDDIKKDTKKNNKKETEDVLEMNLPNLDEVSESSENTENKQTDETENALEMNLPNLDEVSENSENTENKQVNETDDIWKF